MSFDWVDIPLATGEGNSRSPFVSDMELRDLMLVPSPPGSPRPFSIMNTPSLTSPVGTGSGVMRGMLVHGDYVWYVRGTTLYYYDGVNAPTSIGTVAGNPGFVRMAGVGPNKIFVVHPNNAAGVSYVATTSAITTVTVPAGYFGDVTCQDGRVICPRLDTDEWYISDLDDPLTFGALNFSTADALSDVLVGLVSAQREIVLFGKKHTEFWYDAGAAVFPFLRASPGVIERGCYAAASIAKYNESVFFLGDDLRVYRLDGYRPVAVSNEWVERALPSGAILPGAVRASIYVDKGQAFYCLSVSGSSSSVLVYDITNNLWHTREHSQGGVYYIDTGNFVLQAGASPGTRRVFAAVNAGVAGNDLFILDAGTYRDSGTSSDIARFLVCPAFEVGGHRAFEAEVNISMEQTVGVVGSARFDYSDDGGANYKSHGAASVGGSGTTLPVTDQARVRWHRCGSFFRRIHRFVVQANARIAIHSVRARVEVGQ